MSEREASGAGVARARGSTGTGVLTTRAFTGGQVLLVLEGTRCQEAGQYTLQIGRQSHLASPTPEADWLYINHACEPTARLEFDGEQPPRLVACRALAPGQEVTFNYLTTEWDMATPFQCVCAAPSCVGWVRGARYLTPAQCAPFEAWLAPHIRELLREAGRR